MDIDFKGNQKKKRLEEALQGDHAFITFDATKEGVDVPEFLKQNPISRLKVSFKFRGNLELTKEHISAELRFDEGYYTCIVPWAALWCVTTESGEDHYWKEDIPKQAAIIAAKQKVRELFSSKKKVEKKEEKADKKPTLTVIK